ncbi:MAG TPA: C25 family cysteine peptidase, partial [Chitinophagaceae bacterium]|nr:C25 family cysteine peptidase [Chitinophagaceae bacterium]
MKRFLLLLLIASGLKMQAQVYNNEWIDYSKTYFKFKVGATGLYRITQPTLATIGLGSTPAENFQLWRNGKEIPLYTSVQTGPMGGSDYVEFWGEMNDGKPDNALYRQPDFQLSDKWSLQTDTAAFFLTVNTSSANLRLSPTANTIVGSPVPEPYFMCKVGKYWKDKINQGYAALVGDYVYSSSYDQSEGWTSSDIDSGNVNSTSQTNLYTYTGAGAPQSFFSINAGGNALNSRNFQVSINGNSILTQSMDFYGYAKVTDSFSTSFIGSGTATVNVLNQASLQPDRMVIGQYEIVYPRQFNFGGAKNFSFELPANINGNYLEISNFNYNGIAPVLYDLTNGKSYIADIGNPALIKIKLLPSATNRKLILVSEDASNIQFITTFQQRNFVNIALAANQGNYLIITSSALLNGSNGTHPVDDYRAYRSSPAGGGYNAKIYLIDDLIDQFSFGIKMDPLSIRNFLMWARANFSSSIKDVLLIGKGTTYNLFRANESNPNMPLLFFIPTFGQPGSDMLLTAAPGSSRPLTPIGRISVISADEITPYLNKVKQYEQAQALSSPLIADKAWMKNVVHVVGANDPVLQSQLDLDMSHYKQIITDTFYGGKVTTFTKSSTDAVEQLTNNELSNLFQEGIGLFTYFGHSATNVLDFNISSPEQYNNPGKYPVMIVMGCNAGNFFTFNLQRLQVKETISEQFVLSDQHGAVAFIASTGLSIVQYLDIYNSKSYNAISRTKYGKTIGEILDEAINEVYNVTTENDFYARFHCEQNTLHGDPALRLYNFAKPDYVIEDPLVKVSPAFISVAQSQFTVNATMLNIGKAVSGNIVVEVKRTYPDLSTAVIERDTIPAIKYSDSLTFNIPIIPSRDKGLNRITITVDADNAIDELYENNNSITKDVVIYEDEAKPVYPYNYGIVNNQNIKLTASTANPLEPLKQYVMELDTTELFNSPFKVTRTNSSAGGVIEFTPGITFSDSTVYYWRVALVPPSGSPIWNTSSFIYLSGPDFGFNQSHLYQHLKSNMQRIFLDSLSRQWKYKGTFNNIFLRNGVYPSTSSQQSYYYIALNNNPILGPGCSYNEIIFNVVNPTTFKPWKNNYTGPTGLYQSYLSTCGSGRDYNFEYLLTDATWRKKAMDFIDSIPDGFFVMVRSNTNPNTTGNTYPDVWKNDTTVYGANNSLYNKLFSQGFSDLDSFNRPRALGFIFKKNKQSEFTPVSGFSSGIYDGLTISEDCSTPDTLG